MIADASGHASSSSSASAGSTTAIVPMTKNNSPDEITLMENLEHRLREGRWARDVLFCQSSDLFWMCVGVDPICRAPLMHHLDFMQHVIDDKELSEQGASSWKPIKMEAAS
eukprot:2981824-Karenia_brevis.AAC.1